MDTLKELLYKIADASNMDLRYVYKSKLIEGTRKINVPLLNTLNLDVQQSVVSSFVSLKKAQVGILVHVKGHLYVALMYNTPHKTMSAYIVDSSALGVRRIDLVGMIDKVSTIKGAIIKLKGGIKASWSKQDHLTEWKSFK